MRVNYKMINYIAVFCISFFISNAVFAQQATKSDWMASVFIGEKVKPEETGSNEYEIGKPGIGAALSYKERYRIYIMMFSCGAKAVLFTNEFFYLSTAIDLAPDDIFNFTDIYFTSSIEASASYLFLETSFSAEEEYSLFNSKHRGFSVSPGIALRAKIGKSFKINLKESICWSDQTRINNNFSDDTEYNPGSGFEKLETSFSVKWQTSEKWELKFGVTRGSFLKKASESPVVKNGGGKTFWKSKLMITYYFPLFKGTEAS